jgi:hypothetical protein
MAVTINASTVNGLIQTADTSGTLNLQANGTTVLSASPTGVAVTGTITATGGFPGIASGQLQTQVFTAPGTLTTPSTTTSIRVTVVGGGGGGANQAGPAAGTSGGSSAFGSLISATGGSGAPNAPSGINPGSPGTGTVSSGTTIISSNAARNPSSITTYVNGAFVGGLSLNSVPGIAYSTTDRDNGAGAGGGPASINLGGAGGLAVAVVPVTVSTPYPVTVGSGGPSAIPATRGGVGGVVVVEFVG